MNITQAKQQIKDTVRAYLKCDDTGLYAIDPVHQRPVFLMGAPGIGKTAIMEQIASELGIGLVSYSMTHHTRQSALGLPRIEQRSFEGIDVETSEYTMSEIVAAIYDYRERTGLHDGILFLDEINCVSETLYPSMLQFLQYKTFGKHKVPTGWVVVCAGNPPEYNRSVHEFDIVTLDRLREIDVVPDYPSWHGYAVEKGLHPAVITFLETKKDCFYKVESKPGGGKAFVTARGWEDLSDLLTLYEQMDIAADRDLFAQFLHDDEICDQFSVYYNLFNKYRSDYKVGAILEGNADDTVKQRASEAAFDERVALIGLILDALGNECMEVLRLEDVCMRVRDMLRLAKESLLNGASANEVMGALIEDRELRLGVKAEAGTLSTEESRRERMVIRMLRGLLAECMANSAESGEAAFDAIQAAYQENVDAIKPLANAVSAKMDHAFGFVDEVMNPREILIFMAELSTRKTTTQFISHYGNKSYFEHNAALGIAETRADLDERTERLAVIEDDVPDVLDGPSVDESQAVGLKVGAKNVSTQPSSFSKDDRSELAAHYADKQFEYGFASMCKMVLPSEELKGKKVLDIGSRRGRGVYRISSIVGNDGHAIGIDWSPSYVQEASDGMERAWRDSHLKGNNMEFHVAYPEDLISAGIGTSTMDAVYINSVATLLYDQERALREFGRVLKPGGLLILETVFADRDRDESVVEAARELGNSIQAAQTESMNLAWLEAAGFDAPTIEDEYEVPANRGFRPGENVETVPGDEDVNYKAVSLYARKK